MLTGYFPPTSGSVRVNGMDMLQQPRECKRCLGYLPERPPLSDEMTVTAYLTFVCQLKEVRREAIEKHTGQIMDTCGLKEVAQRRVGNLSKGYRQRVGVAQARCGNPPVLVLDEPTVGLDPRQVKEIRELIRQLGKEHTVIFSSHLLPEIQQLCDRVVILHKGKLIREAAMAELTGGDGETIRLRATVAMKERLLLPALNSLDCVRRVKVLPHPRRGLHRAGNRECLRETRAGPRPGAAVPPAGRAGRPADAAHRGQGYPGGSVPPGHHRRSNSPPGFMYRRS